MLMRYGEIDQQQTTAKRRRRKSIKFKEHQININEMSDARIRTL